MSRKNWKRSSPEVQSGAGHTLIISSKYENHTAEQVVTKLRGVVDAREMGLAVDRLRKARNQKMVMNCSSAEDTLKIEERLKIRGANLKVTKGEKKTAYGRHPGRPQNKHRRGHRQIPEDTKQAHRRPVSIGVGEGKGVLQEMYKRLIKAGHVYVGLQRRPVWDQSPLAQCSHCLGYGHSRRFCREASEKCAHCGGDHVDAKCRSRSAEEPPKCINCMRAGRADTAHGGFSSECSVRHKWDEIARSKSNLQHSKLATSELLVEADRRKIAVALVQKPYVGNIGELRRYPGCRVVQKVTTRRRPVKAAIIILNSGVDVEEDQTLIDRNVTAAVIKAGNCRIGVVSMYFEGDIPIGPYLDRVRYVCSKLGTDKIILGGDVTAWSVWSVVDVTACGSALLDRVEKWQVVRDVTSSDHNAVTFAVRMGRRSGPRPPRYTGLQHCKGSMVRARTSHGCYSN
ncbi:hypothetical protein EVAR_32782_1 [Eumeta japonica]|uniref:Uncharacterized protein n=1 Tax=Eumeta variegata TaxID=151549 RepID=A0A4C1WE69_EUMVA|nr:hypothetical protein EVAR_32782_1 [Eumeta japonica]